MKMDKETLVPIGAAGSVVIIGLGAVLWLQGQLLTTSNKLDMILHDLQALSNRVDGGLTKSEVASWIKLLRSENPTLKIPDLDR